jgi:hypothetical protein
MGCWSKWDIGGCGCVSNPCDTNPCILPQVTLHTNITLPGHIQTQHATLTYVACTWSSVCTVGFVNTSYKIAITVVAGVTIFTFTEWISTTNCSGTFRVGTWKSDGSGSGVTLTSYTCSPLDMIFTDASGYAIEVVP